MNNTTNISHINRRDIANESPTMSHEEDMEIVRYTLDVVKGEFLSLPAATQTAPTPL